jgi:hypothetical protein
MKLDGNLIVDSKSALVCGMSDLTFVTKQAAAVISVIRQFLFCTKILTFFNTMYEYS